MPNELFGTSGVSTLQSITRKLSSEVPKKSLTILHLYILASTPKNSSKNPEALGLVQGAQTCVLMGDKGIPSEPKAY